jgi:hypothetical protein
MVEIATDGVRCRRQVSIRRPITLDEIVTVRERFDSVELRLC